MNWPPFLRHTMTRVRGISRGSNGRGHLPAPIVDHAGWDPCGRGWRRGSVPYGPFPVRFRCGSGEIVRVASAAASGPADSLPNLSTTDPIRPSLPNFWTSSETRKFTRRSFSLITMSRNQLPLSSAGMFEEGHTVGQHSGDRWLMLHSPVDYTEPDEPRHSPRSV
jgi:hypothetical protein